MAFLFIGGTRIQTVFERSRRARCGKCLKKTEQAVSILEASDHLYFIEYNREQVGKVAECEACHTVFPVKASGGPSRKERWAAAFLDAHVHELERADKSNWVALGVVGLGFGLLLTVGLSFYLLSLLPIDRGYLFWVGFAVLLGQLGGAGWIYRGLQERVGDHLFARSARLRLAALRERYELTPADLAEAAAQRGYGRLARHFATPRYTPAVTSSAPYR